MPLTAAPRLRSPPAFDRRSATDAHPSYVPFHTATRGLAVAVLLVVSAIGSADLSARERDAGPPDGSPSFVVVGAGALAEYEGADARRTVPFVVARARVGRTSIEITGTRARLGIVGDGRFVAGPVIGVVGARDDTVDDARVAAFEPVDPSFEPGAFATWRVPLGRLPEGEAELDATLTSAVNGDWEGTGLALEAAYSWAATPLWRLAVGLSATAVDDAYAASRFGVSDADAVASGLPAYAPDGGLKDIGVSLRSILSFSPRYGVFARVAYTRLLGDAVDSPLVVDAGDADQTFVGIGLFVALGR